jgi:hypothetical protein
MVTSSLSIFPSTAHKINELLWLSTRGRARSERPRDVVSSAIHASQVDQEMPYDTPHLHRPSPLNSLHSICTHAHTHTPSPLTRLPCSVSTHTRLNSCFLRDFFFPTFFLFSSYSSPKSVLSTGKNFKDAF